MKGKKIILAVTNDLTYDRRMFRICSTLAAAGAEVTLVGRKFKHSKPFLPERFHSIRFRCWINKGPLFYAEYNIRLLFVLWRQNFDIACACDLDTAPAIHIAARYKSAASVYDAHEYFSEVPELRHRPIVKAIWEWIARRTIPHFDVHYTVGEELARLMGSRYQVHFEVVRNIEPYPNPPASRKTHVASKKILLYQGALNVGRGLEACIEAMTWLPDWEFWLAGEGDITKTLKELSARSGVGERIRFLGWVQPAELPALLQQATLSINLREAGSLNDYYSLPNKFFDAIHAGVPSINMDYPEYKTIIAQYPCGVLIDRVDARLIADTIQDIDRHPEKWEQMIAACHNASAHFTWEQEEIKLRSIYDRL